MVNEKVVDDRPYQVIQSENVKFLVDIVNEAIERGYKPIGSMLVTRSGGLYTQTIYRETK